MWSAIFFFIGGIVGNLIAGWIQQDIFHNVFSRNRMIATILFAMVATFAGVYFQPRALPQSNGPVAINQGDVGVQNTESNSTAQIASAENITGSTIFQNINEINLVVEPSPPPTIPGPTPTPNAHAVSINELVGSDRTIIRTEVINLDGQGADEIVVSSEKSNYVDRQLSVYAFTPKWTWEPEQWQQVLAITGWLEGASCPYLGDFGIASLLADNSYQVIPYTLCGSSALLTFEIYKYDDDGLGFMPRIYTIADEDIAKWYESSPTFRNGRFFVGHGGRGQYEYTLDQGQLVGQPVIIDEGSIDVTIDYWLDLDTYTIKASEEYIQMKVGQVLYLRTAESVQDLADVRLQLSVNDPTRRSFEWVGPDLLRSAEPGIARIYLWGFQDPFLTVEVVEPNNP